MKWLSSFFTCLFSVCCWTNVNAQVVVNPVFDRTDSYQFRVDKVYLASDTTYIYCSYKDKGDSSWINISKDTYLEDVSSGIRYPLLKASGLPYSPEKMYYTDSINAQVTLYFPHIDTKRFDIIENEDNKAFNIYGINLNSTFDTPYTSEDIAKYFNLSMQEDENENWQAAINYALKQLESANFVCGVRSFPSACAMFNLTMEFANINECEKMIEWGKNAIDILRTLPQDSMTLDVLARTYGNVGVAYQVMNQQDISNQYRELSLSTRRIIGKTRGLDYDEYLLELADRYHSMGNYPKALLYGKEVADIYKKKFDENRDEYGCVYVSTLSNLCTCYSSMKKHEEAIKTIKQAINLIEDGACERTSWQSLAAYRNYACELAIIGEADKAVDILQNIKSYNSEEKSNRVVISSKMFLANIYLEYKQDTIKAISELKSLLKTVEDSIAVGKNDNRIYAGILEGLYESYKNSDSEIALQYLKKLIQVEKQWNGEESVAYAKACIKYVQDFIVFKNAIDDKIGRDSLLYYLRQSSDIFKRQINNSVYNMSKREREDYWRYYKNLYTLFIPMACSIFEGTKDANTMAYDAALFFKGLQLSSEVEFKDVVLSSHDDPLMDLYREYVNNLSLLEEQYNSIDYIVNRDSLKKVIKNQEYLLSQKVTRFNKLNKGTNVTWKEVKDILGTEDIAIEIVDFSFFDEADETYYYAYVIDKKTDVPTITFLFDDTMLNNCISEGSVDYKELYELIWGNEYLSDVIKDIKNIYFSASGRLNSLGIEYLPMADGQYICDKYNIYRLSSTRELCYANSPIKTERVCLFGGLDYNNEAKIDIDDNSKQTNRVSRAVEESIVKRGGFDPLFGSKQEIVQINNEMVKRNVDCSVYTDLNGTEESFKNLSGSPINIIHLSTHGMYVPDEGDSISKKNNFRFIISDETPDVDEETQSLSRSFLVMSGGNMLIRRDSIPNGKEDGILTALEISHLDFENLDLVVLSACQTALGTIDTEGVYGLQRAFKKAGAYTILMSLDKVDDEATQILMVEFYKNLMAGKSKHQSLKDAQKYLRQVENGKYDKPEYWASFIMLDGLN